MGFFTSNEERNTPMARRRHLTNMRLITLLAGGYILYEGIKQVINSKGTTPVWFYVYLVLFAVAIVFAFLLNEKRIKAIDKLIAEQEEEAAHAAKEAGTEEPGDLDEYNDLDDPNK